MRSVYTTNASKCEFKSDLARAAKKVLNQDRIPELKSALLPILSCTELKKESANSFCGPCPVCGGVNRFVYRLDSGRCWCRNCRPEDQSMDIIDFHCWLTGKTIADLMREYLPGAHTPPRLIAQDLLCTKRGLATEVVKVLLETRGLSVTNHAGKQCVAVPYLTLQGEIKATQYLSIDQEPFPFTEKNGKPNNKIFGKGSKSGDDCFFFAGTGLEQANEIIITESVINAMTAHQWFPDACCIALGGSTYTRKVNALKPYINDTKTVRVAQDNDSAGEKMVQAIKKILNGQDVYYFAWKPNDKPGMDINDFLQAGQTTAPEWVMWGIDVKSSSANAKPPFVNDDWGFAKNRFPKTQFPWDVLPTRFSASLKQLARSCAASPTHLPGITFGILAAVLGRHVEIKVKSSWSEPLIFWMLALLPSGQGKSPAQNALSAPIYAEQERFDNTHKKAMEIWRALPADEQAQTPKPEPLGGIFTTDMTIEGLRSDQRKCGGVLVSNDEASSFFEGQNQYKKSGKGTDRESWLKLYDGNPARIVRTTGAVFLKSARASIIGGTQPSVFWRIFKPDTKGGDIFLVDGTIFRFMMTYEGEKFFPMVTESWDDFNRAEWDGLIQNALQFCQEHTGVTLDGEEEILTHKLWFTEETLEAFIDWANDLKSISSKLPEPVRGFIPKLQGWAVRLTGIIKCLEFFLTGSKVPQIIGPEDLQKGIRLAEFYMGHNVDVVHAITSCVAPVKDIYTDQEIHLAKTLQDIKGDVDSSRLAIGFIWEKFNESCPSELQYKSSRAMGGLIRSCNLTVSGGKHDANGKRAVNCLQWDKTTDLYIENCLQSLQSLQTQEGQRIQNADINKSTSAKSAKNSDIAENMQTLQTMKTQSLQAEPTANKGDADNADEFFGNIPDEITI